MSVLLYYKKNKRNNKQLDMIGKHNSSTILFNENKTMISQVLETQHKTSDITVIG